MKDVLFERWKAFHAANPKVYALFKKFAFQALGKGRKRFGARMIWERMRWYVMFETVDDVDYKLNDHHLTFYSRQFMRDFPQWKGFFEIRTRRIERLL